jgi:hypothetical protein
VKRSISLTRLDNSAILNRSGQAVIEYVLMLVITVSLVLALVSQLFKPFGQFIDSYMGDYFSCLIEYGELPTLDSADGSPADGDCRAKLGAAGGFNTAGGSRRGSGGRSPSDSDGNSGSSASQSGAGNESSGGGGSSGGTYAGSASRGGGRNINSRRFPSSGVESAGAQGKVVEIAADGNGNSGYFGGSNSAGRVGRSSSKKLAVGISGLSEFERKKLEKKSSGGSGPSISTEGVGPAPKKMIVKKPEQKAIVQEEKEVTIGNFIRYLFIAALVIALVIFIGGQAAQMSKSSD